MPLYEYECDACGHGFERIQKFSDPLVEVCPVCEGAVRKLISSPAFHLKGSGWYATDYAKKGADSADRAGEGEGESEKKAEKAEKKDGKTKEAAAKPKDAAKDAKTQPKPSPPKKN